MGFLKFLVEYPAFWKFNISQICQKVSIFFIQLFFQFFSLGRRHKERRSFPLSYKMKIQSFEESSVSELKQGRVMMMKQSAGSGSNFKRIISKV